MTQKRWLGLVCRNWTSLGGWVESPWFVEQGTGSGDVPYSEKEKQCQLFLFRVREREQLSILERMCALRTNPLLQFLPPNADIVLTNASETVKGINIDIFQPPQKVSINFHIVTLTLDPTRTVVQLPQVLSYKESQVPRPMHSHFFSWNRKWILM